MNLSKHCQLCENRQYDINTGTKCKLTDQEPSFQKKCPEIKFDEKLDNTIKEINTEYELVKRSKSLSIGNFIFFLVVSIAFIGTGIYLGVYIFDKGVLSTVPIIVIAVGIGVLPLASGPLNKYIQGIKVAEKKREELNEVLDLYNIKYNINVIIKKDLHDNLDISHELTFLRKHYK
ncbi:hypothetical protein [Marinigracilibium pacificum]|uniref:Uncharacterized protein n=1 Tax=Marinigracilibium pacificum TaxID=2729599 RepID=A0A848IUY5_9BACT|nr:hypothetical protein [Marinigracilibium pacificum]NMM48147.1 hypothetical protein [Marinigracilibium pacificum]